MINPIIFEAGLPATAVATIAGIAGWRRSRKHRYAEALAREQERRERLLDGSSILRPLGDEWLRAKGAGQIPIVSIGGYGSRQLPFILRAFLKFGSLQPYRNHLSPRAGRGRAPDLPRQHPRHLP